MRTVNASVLLLLTLFLALFFGLAAIGQYLFIRFEVRQTVLDDLRDSVHDIDQTIAYDGGINLERFNRSLIDASDFFCVLSSGAVVDIGAGSKGMIRGLLPPIQPAFNVAAALVQPIPVTSNITGGKETWTVYAKRLDSGMAVLGISSFDQSGDAAKILVANMNRVSNKLVDWQRLSVNTFDNVIHFFVMNESSQLVNGWGRIPISTDPMALGRHIDTSSDIDLEGKPYIVLYGRITERSAGTVGTIITATSIEKENGVIRLSLFFDLAVAGFSFVVFLVLAALYFSKHEKERRELRQAFQKYLSPKVMEAILRDPGKLSLGGQRREVTILFSDIRSFTTLSERIPPQQLTELLQEYFEAMTEEVLNEEGVVDKYIGDAIMAFWGAPIEQPDQADRAVRTAKAMISKLSDLTESWAQRGYPVFDIGIGINLGVATVGNMGSSKRFDYTVVGDTVNAASRLEQLTKDYANHIIISESTKIQLTIGAKLRDLGDVTVKGKEKPIRIFEVLPD